MLWERSLKLLKILFPRLFALGPVETGIAHGDDARGFPGIRGFAQDCGEQSRGESHPYDREERPPHHAHLMPPCLRDSAVLC